MIHGYHATFGMYGSWLPNDPRGSASRYVGSRPLYDVGGRTFGPDRRRLEQLTPQQQSRLAALRRTLKRPFVVFSDSQIAAMGKTLHRFVQTARLEVWACAILPCHVHLVFARCGKRAELVIDSAKRDVDEQFGKQGLLPAGCDEANSMFAEKQWIVYLDSEQAIEAAIHYVVENPEGEGRPKQYWPFVVPFPGLDRNLVAYHD